METVIPAEVLKHLREIAHQKTDPLGGGYTQAQAAEAMGLTQTKARNVLRQLIVEGKLYSRRVGINQDDAQELGYLSGCSVPAYFFREG